MTKRSIAPVLIADTRIVIQVCTLAVSLAIVLLPAARTPGVTWAFRTLLLVYGVDLTWRRHRQGLLTKRPGELFQAFQSSDRPKLSVLDRVMWPAILIGLFYAG